MKEQPISDAEDWRTSLTQADKRIAKERTAQDINAKFRSFFKSDIVNPVEKHQRRTANAAELAEAYAEVDQLDQGVCWVTGHHTGGVGDNAREHHHTKGRNVRPEWRADVNHILTMTRLAHRLVTIGWIVQEGDDRRKPIRFHWADHVKPEQKPFRIRSKRWSANE